MSVLPLTALKFREFDANGDPLAGGKLYTYAAGTTTPQDTFTTRAGTIANANPVVLDANGEADVWITTGLLYKFVLKNSADVVQKTVDNVPSGSGESSSTDLAVAIDPGGRLTLTTGFPVPEIDVTGAASVLYTAQLHNKVPLYDGSAWTLATFASELSQTLSDTTKSPGAAANGNEYDMFVWNDSGTIRLSRGPAWSSDTSRGTGAGTTELERVDGRRVNKYAISNGPAAQRGLYVGTIRVASGGVSDSLALRHVWNAYNRVRRPMRVTDATASWDYSTGAYRQANGNAANQLDFVIGLTGEAVLAEVLGKVSASAVGSFDLLISVGVGVGLDSATVNSASPYLFAAILAPHGSSALSAHVSAHYEGFPGIGRHVLEWLEWGSDAGGDVTTSWVGTVITGIFGHLFA